MNFVAFERTLQGTGASRRLRNAGKVPGIVYGAVIMDDMIDTAGTLVKAAEVLKERGARSVYAYCTHAVFSGPAIERIKGSQLDEVVITNTIPLSDAAKGCKKIRQLSVAFLFAETIRRISDGESVTSLFAEQNNNF